MARPTDPPLRRSDVVKAALTLLDQGGIDSFTMRRLAAALEVTAPTLYHHFRNKDEILREVGLLIVAPVQPLEAPGDPVEAVVIHSLRYYEALLEHPAALPLIMPEFTREASPGWYEYFSGLLRAARIPQSDLIAAIDALDALVHGSAVAAANADIERLWFQRADLDNHPNLKNAVGADRYDNVGRLEKAVRAMLLGWARSDIPQPVIGHVRSA